METFTLRACGLSSDQEWAVDPDMIEVTISQSFLDKAKKCIDFMQEADVAYVCIWYAFPYTLFALAENHDEDNVKGLSLVTGPDGKEYFEFTPEYRIDGCNAKIFKDGEVKAVMPFKHTSEELWCVLGKVDELRVVESASA